MITKEQDEITQEIRVAASADRIFSALTNPAELTVWWGDEATYRCNSWKVDLRVGGHWRAEGIGSGGNPFFVEGEYLEIDPPKVLVYTWKASWHTIPPTTVRWVLVPRGCKTLVLVTHSGFASNLDALDDHKNGWPSVLLWLDRYVSQR